jgi:hypothetical protein
LSRWDGVNRNSYAHASRVLAELDAQATMLGGASVTQDHFISRLSNYFFAEFQDGIRLKEQWLRAHQRGTPCWLKAVFESNRP